MSGSAVPWMLVSWATVALAYLGWAIFVLGMAYRAYRYLRTPMRLPVALTPAPETETGAVFRIVTDILLFPSLFKADKGLWAGSWLFHVTLAAIIFRHLRYVVFPVPDLVGRMETVALVVGCIFGCAILYLLGRRLVLARALYLSTLSDYLTLLLLGSIVGTGLLMSDRVHVDLVEAKAFLLGLLTLSPVPPPRHPLFLTHFLLFLALVAYFPFSKLLHAAGVLFSPTRHQPFRLQQTGLRGVRYRAKPVTSVRRLT